MVRNIRTGFMVFDTNHFLSLNIISICLSCPTPVNVLNTNIIFAFFLALPQTFNKTKLKK